ncbi:MAG: carboxypeptidase regulatory-like domain-containing protein [Candidatus Hydrogenedentes bacterium]|nr:carboxypeptidase regulatory-like domain-containing protein [Candidatus Hydrogenedentota bacterium]
MASVIFLLVTYSVPRIEDAPEEFEGVASPAQPELSPPAQVEVLPAPEPPHEPSGPEGNAFIRLTVLARDGNPESGASVEAIHYSPSDARGAPAPSARHDAVTDARGAALFEGLATGTYLLEARKDDRAALAMVNISDPNGGAVETLVLAPASKIAGRVTDTTGEPVPDASVAVLRKDHRPFELDGARLAVTVGPDGAFTFEALPPGYYEFVAEATGYAPAYSEPVQPGAKSVTLVLGPGGRIQGVVRSAADGSAVPGFPVGASALGGDHEVPPVRSDAAGRFVLDGVSEDTYVVYGASDNLVLAGEPLRVPVDSGAPGLSVELFVEAAVTVSGKVFEEATGEGLANVVVATIFNVEFAGVKKTVTDGGGNYTLTGIPARSGVFEFVHARESHQINAEIPPDADGYTLDFAWPSSTTLSGTVIDAAGDPVPGAEVRAWTPLSDTPEDYWTANGQTDAHGKFHLAKCRASDEVHMKAIGGSGESAILGPIALTAAGRSDIVLQLDDSPGASIAGFVTDAHGAPALARLRLRRYEEQEEGPQVRRNAYTEADGFFYLAGLPAGAYFVEIGPYHNPGAGAGTPQPAGEITLRPGEHQSGLRFTIEYGASIYGVITDESGVPVPHASVALTVQDAPGARYTGQTDAFGRFELHSIPEGEHLLAVSRNGYGSITYRGARAGDTIDLVLPSQGNAIETKPGIEWEETETVYRPIQSRE